MAVACCSWGLSQRGTWAWGINNVYGRDTQVLESGERTVHLVTLPGSLLSGAGGPLLSAFGGWTSSSGWVARRMSSLAQMSARLSRKYLLNELPSEWLSQLICELFGGREHVIHLCRTWPCCRARPRAGAPSFLP